MAQRSARHKLLVAVVAIGMVVGLLSLWPSRGPDHPTATAGGRQPRVSPIPAGVVGGPAPPAGLDRTSPDSATPPVPGGFNDDAAGARAAALAFVKLSERYVALDEPAALAVQRAVASTAAADDLAAEVHAKLARLRAAWPTGSLTYRVAPLAVRVTPAGAEAYTGDVWYVGVVDGAHLRTYEEWVTESYRLVWERGDWRMASRTTTPGPRPEASPSPAVPTAQMDALLAGFVNTP